MVVNFYILFSDPKDSFRQSTITSHFPVRRSNRRCKSVIQVLLLDKDTSSIAPNFKAFI